MDLLINKKTIEKTTKCLFRFNCFSDKTYPRCTAENPIAEHGLFVRFTEPTSCHYKMSFGNGFICTCPTRYEIFKLYRQ